jgi:hypothetical protein
MRPKHPEVLDMSSVRTNAIGRRYRFMVNPMNAFHINSVQVLARG